MVTKDDNKNALVESIDKIGEIFADDQLRAIQEDKRAENDEKSSRKARNRNGNNA